MTRHLIFYFILIFGSGCTSIKKVPFKIKKKNGVLLQCPSALFIRSSVFVLLLLFSSICFGNKIDDLKTPEDVLKFIKRTFDKQDRFQTKPRTPNAIDFKFIKLDLNKDGLTDVLINGTYLYAIIDNGGRNNFEENYIGGRHFNCELLSIDSSGKLPLLIVQKDDDYDNDLGKDIKFNPDTLVNNYGGFIEYNSSPKQIDFNEIKIMTSPCFGTCPTFELTITKNRQAILNAKQYNRLTGIYKSVMDDKIFSDLVGLLSYINIDSLKNNYQIGWTDNPSIDIQILYNGLTKKVHDYGLEGTFGLKRLYEVLYKIKATQDWE